MDISTSETENELSDDSREDPTFYVSSSLWINTKMETRTFEGQDDSEEETSDAVEVVVPEPYEQDQTSYETIKKIIEVGQVERLTMDQCKVYLRNHGLRLSGTKATLTMRIKEHMDIVNGGGKNRYPASSFVLNCRGDACVGDVVMFKQKVYEKFNAVSRSANGTCGTRVVAGRIVKESYGAAKQQHTFTIEVLWSKGDKTLPPLYPMLIKGRNLYRLKTRRQKWEDEEERLKILSEKHARGNIARSNREARIKQREARNISKQKRETRDEHRSRKERKKEPLHSVSMKPENQSKWYHDMTNTQEELNHQQKIRHYSRTCKVSIPIQLRNLQEKPVCNSDVHMQAHGLYPKQPLSSMNHIHQASLQFGYCNSSRSPSRGGFHDEQDMSYQTARSSIHRSQPPIYSSSPNHQVSPYQIETSEKNWNFPMRSPSNRYSHQGNLHAYPGQRSNACRNRPLQEWYYEQKHTCRYYTQGRCFYGDKCTYLHE